MISFDLKCETGHVFEAWFRSSTSYEDQRSSGQISCPVCGDTQVDKAVMAPAVSAKGNRRNDPGRGTVPMASPQDGPMPSTEQMKAVLNAIMEAQAKSLEQSQWVGDKFSDRARAMHYGEESHAPIHGTANLDEARSMIEEGLAVAPLVVPVAPPDQTH